MITGLVNEFVTQRPFVIAHRCAGGHWPEFSARGVRGAVGLGVRALEVSLHTTATGEWVCSHDRSTVRVTGVDHDIPETPWEVLRELRTKPDQTTDPSQSATPLLLFTELLELAPPDQVLFIDHKETSTGRGEDDPRALEHERRLLDFLDSVPGLSERVVWKVFAPGQPSRRRAAERGYPSWGAHYSARLDKYIDAADQFDLLGLEWDAPEEAWKRLIDVGRPVIAHIITAREQGDRVLGLGASGLMCSTPADFADLLPPRADAAS